MSESLRFKTSYAELDKLAPRPKPRGATQEIRANRAARFKGKVRRIRQVQQSENGLVEFPFGLFDAMEKSSNRHT